MGLVTVQVEAGPEDLDRCGQHSKARPALRGCGRGRSILSETPESGRHAAQGRENSRGLRAGGPCRGGPRRGSRAHCGDRDLSSKSGWRGHSAGQRVWGLQTRLSHG